MFNFRKKKVLPNKLDKTEADFIEAIVNKLSFKYPLFKQEYESETFVGISKNPGGSNGSFTYFIDNNSWKKICDTSINNFFIKNINFNSFDGKKVIVDLFTSEGLIIGYKTNVDINDVDIATIDVSKIWEKHFLNKDYQEIRVILNSLSPQELKKLNLAKNTFKIRVNNKEYYTIQDIGDGNYLVLNKEGIVFKATHDPFEIKKIYNSVQEYLNSISPSYR